MEWWSVFIASLRTLYVPGWPELLGRSICPAYFWAYVRAQEGFWHVISGAGVWRPYDITW